MGINDEKFHSPTSASSMYRWTKCPGSVQLIPKLDQSYAEDSRYQKEGALAHSLASQEILRPGYMSGQDVSPEMAQAVAKYVEIAKEILGQANEWWLEHQFRHPSFPNLYGTVDLAAIIGDTLVILDFKYGIGVPVHVENNYQLLYYANLVLSSIPTAGIAKVRLGIFQPRLSPEPQWVTMSVAEIMQWVSGVLYPALHAADTDPSLAPGSHCQFCPARAQCPALDILFQGFLDCPVEPLRLSPDGLALVVKYAKAVKSFIKACEDELIGILKTGVKVPGVKLVEIKGRGGSGKRLTVALSSDKRPEIVPASDFMESNSDEIQIDQTVESPLHE